MEFVKKIKACAQKKPITTGVFANGVSVFLGLAIDKLLDNGLLGMLLFGVCIASGCAIAYLCLDK